MKDLTGLLGKQNNKRLVVVYPHPDDEAELAGGLLQVAKKLGFHTTVICMTKGGEGRLWIHPKGRTTKEVRESEFRKSCKILKVDNLVLGNFSDSNLRFTVSEWEGWLASEIKKMNPSVVVTYDHSGLYGHPDHIVLSLELSKIVKKMKSSPILLWSTFDDRILRRLTSDEVMDYKSYPNYYLQMSPSQFVNKLRAIRAHKSQGLLELKAVVGHALYARGEWYHEVDLDKDYKYKYFDNEYDGL